MTECVRSYASVFVCSVHLACAHRKERIKYVQLTLSRHLLGGAATASGAEKKERKERRRSRRTEKSIYITWCKRDARISHTHTESMDRIIKQYIYLKNVIYTSQALTCILAYTGYSPSSGLSCVSVIIIYEINATFSSGLDSFGSYFSSCTTYRDKPSPHCTFFVATTNERVQKNRNPFTTSKYFR